jgi:hypothetical protein
MVLASSRSFGMDDLHNIQVAPTLRPGYDKSLLSVALLDQYLNTVENNEKLIVL